MTRPPHGIVLSLGLATLYATAAAASTPEQVAAYILANGRDEPSRNGSTSTVKVIGAARPADGANPDGQVVMGAYDPRKNELTLCRNTYPRGQTQRLCLIDEGVDGIVNSCFAKDVNKDKSLSSAVSDGGPAAMTKPLTAVGRDVCADAYPSMLDIMPK